MEELTSELAVGGVICELLRSCELTYQSDLVSREREDRFHVLLGIARNPSSATPFLCARRALL